MLPCYLGDEPTRLGLKHFDEILSSFSVYHCDCSTDEGKSWVCNSNTTFIFKWLMKDRMKGSYHYLFIFLMSLWIKSIFHGRKKKKSPQQQSFLWNEGWEINLKIKVSLKAQPFFPALLYLLLEWWSISINNQWIDTTHNANWMWILCRKRQMELPEIYLYTKWFTFPYLLFHIYSTKKKK